MEIRLKTLTPLWTGGADQTCDRIHETGIIGSLRWWYEALVRGLGGSACDPTNDGPSQRCRFDTKAYEEAKRSGKSPEEAIQAGMQTLCPVSYLFGATGWARLFQLRVLDTPTTHLHFVTNLTMNAGWLKRVFGGETSNIDNLRVPFGNIHLHLVPRGYDVDYVIRQVYLILRLAAEYGGLGARLQHGFGQVTLELSPALESIGVNDGLRELSQRLPQWAHFAEADPSPFNLRYFVSQTYEVPEDKVNRFRLTVGNQSSNPLSYIPCVFDLRYKGSGKWGMRRWLEEEKGWRSSDDPKQLGRLDELMGPRSQWGPKSSEKKIDDELRTAGRVFFGMPYRTQQNVYRIKVFGFALPRLLTTEELDILCREYMDYALGSTPIRTIFGKDLLANAGGGTSK